MSPLSPGGKAVTMNKLYEEFGLTLMVNHACNLRCVYCYTGAKFHSPMPWDTGRVGIERAFRSVRDGGRVSVGFFGGEPLLAAEQITEWMKFARHLGTESAKRIRFNLTTNGTVLDREAWAIMLAEDLELAVSFDGMPALQNRQRPDTHGRGSAETVEATLRRLMDAGKAFRVVCVVRPGNLEEIPEGLKYLHELGVREFDLALDLWSSWTAADGVRLQAMVEAAATLWRQWLPRFSLNCFDAKAARLAHLPETEVSHRCGFGAGEIAVAPSGRLYPCERLIGEDEPGHAMVLPGHVLEGEDFLRVTPRSFEQCSPCSRCSLRESCETTCRCSNFIRTGDVHRPDGLLCILNKATTQATTKVLSRANSPVVLKG
jgi:uncharacterized protein